MWLMRRCKDREVSREVKFDYSAFRFSVSAYLRKFFKNLSASSRDLA